MLFQLLYIPGFVNLACRLLLPPSKSRGHLPKLTLSHIFFLSPSPFLGPLPTLLSMSEPSNGTNQRAASGRERRPSEKLLQLCESFFLCRLQLLSQTYTSIAEARRERENSKHEAAQRSKQRSKKRAVFQRKVAEREQASHSGKNKKNGNLIMSYYSAFQSASNSAHCCLTTSTESYPCQ
jgi:hypothetical protein